MRHTITLTGSYGQTRYRVTGLDPNTTINADNASWIVDNDSGDGDGTNYYPFLVNSSPGVIIDGGTISGEIDMTSEWRTVYDRGNSAAIEVEGSPGVVIQDWRITQAWDAVRVTWDSNNFLIQDVWATDIRDDAVENDKLLSGTIRHSLFDGVFSGISVDPSSSSPVDGHNETVTLDGVLLRMESYLYKGEITHSSPVKTDSATNGTVTPNLRFINNVIAIEDVTHRSYRSLQDAWNNTIESSGNYYLNLSDTPLPADYPLPPAGWTVLQGQAARDYWQKARAEWINKHQSADGGAGGDIPTGGLGIDALTGGAGYDSFVFDTNPSSGNSDLITDFNPVYDTIGLENAVFTKVGAAGKLAPGAFHASMTGKAHDASDRLIYDQDGGQLYYDADGTGAGAAVQVAQLQADLALTYSDFFVI